MAARSMFAVFCALFLAFSHPSGGEIVKGSVNLNSGVFDKVYISCLLTNDVLFAKMNEVIELSKIGHRHHQRHFLATDCFRFVSGCT